MYSIKKVPEDFKVWEISSIKPGEVGKYAYFQLQKTGYTTTRAMQRIADFLKIPLKQIGYAGNKDKKAVTIQNFSIKGADENSLSNFVDDNIKIEYLGKGGDPISLGDLEGNRFEIIAYSDKHPKPIAQTINYFDEQRFSSHNVEIGLAIARGNFEKASGLVDDPAVVSYLKQQPNDHVGALKCLPFKVLSIYLHALSSYIYNSTSAEYLQCKYNCKISEYSQGIMAFPEESVENTMMPIVGYATQYEDKEKKKIIRAVLDQLGITERSFIIRAIPELSNEGNERNLAVNINDLKIEEIEKGKYKITFTLPKGSYATIVIRHLFL